eukprot:NODE_3437_length_2035_cov_17.477463.p1 GENE.NODE_3437_length_2035_cov_17.477463~~NODE_3437_length_2035_cov_17.477463.p1  ORF type:complete len:547 (-),score=166.80 NODE_3437_length_2035_cov_17.477463:258-1898(-)
MAAQYAMPQLVMAQGLSNRMTIGSPRSTQVGTPVRAPQVYAVTPQGYQLPQPSQQPQQAQPIQQAACMSPRSTLRMSSSSAQFLPQQVQYQLTPTGRLVPVAPLLSAVVIQGKVMAAEPPPSSNAPIVVMASRVPAPAPPEPFGKGLTPDTLGWNRALAKRLGEVLEDKHSFKEKCKEIYQRIASSGGLDIDGMIEFRCQVEEAYGLPEIPVEDYRDAFERFDFDGNGSLDLHEVVKLMKVHMTMRRREVGIIEEIAVPYKTPKEAGFTVVRVLASGGQGTASLVTDSTGSECVLKSYSQSNSNASGIDELKEEMESMISVGGHPGIAHCFEIFQDHDNFYMTSGMNYGGDLTSLRRKAQEQGVRMSAIWWKKLFYQAFSALEYMHRKAVMHCDIKEPNLMIKNTEFDKPTVVIIDLSMAWFCDQGERGVCGTPGYIPPEVFLEGKWFPKGDVFSMGVVMVQLLANMVPDEEAGVPGIFQQDVETMDDAQDVVMNTEPPIDRMEIQDPDLLDLVKRCLAKQRAVRVKAPQALQSRWLQLGGKPLPT